MVQTCRISRHDGSPTLPTLLIQESGARKSYATSTSCPVLAFFAGISASARLALVTGYRPYRDAAEMLLFVAITSTLSWASFVLIGGSLYRLEAPLAVRLLAASFLYLGCTGWQPLLAVWLVGLAHRDRARHRIRFMPLEMRCINGAIVGSAVLSLSAMLVASWRHFVFSDDTQTEAALAAELWAPDTAFLLGAAVWMAGLLIVAQTLAEEVGWRGFFLQRSMRLLGPWLGLCFHGFVWGIWYAPIVLMTNGDITTSTLASLCFVITCCMLGILLGWLRLASNSLAPSVIANALLSLFAGVPLLLCGDDPGLRAAAYRPAGWLPMAVYIVLLATSRLRRFVRVPEPDLAC
jgi:membrane protease YdiL (CAAX protease family)